VISGRVCEYLTEVQPALGAANRVDPDDLVPNAEYYAVRFVDDLPVLAASKFRHFMA
jgi:hypothetical protein